MMAVWFVGRIFVPPLPSYLALSYSLPHDVISTITPSSAQS